MDSNTDIHGGNNQLLPNATHAEQHIHNYYVNLPPEDNHRQVESFQGEYHLFVTHDSVNVPKLIQKAKSHIVMHAAYYPKYATDHQGTILMEVLKSKPYVKLHVIFTEIENNPWIDEFSKVLRIWNSVEDQKREMLNSLRHFEAMKKKFRSKNQITISSTKRLPMFPVILIDDTIVVGHYAHSYTPAPLGLWLTIKHKRIPEMYAKICSTSNYIASLEDEEERAIIRYLEELKICGTKKKSILKVDRM